MLATGASAEMRIATMQRTVGTATIRTPTLLVRRLLGSYKRCGRFVAYNQMVVGSGR